MTRQTFQSSMHRLEADVAGMGRLAQAMLHDGLQSIETVDKDLAETVKARAASLAAMDESIETAALGILMLQAPVASDLRRIGAVLKLITYINRVGRYGFDIAKAVDQLPPEGIRSIGLVSIRQMGRNVERMLDLVLAAFRDHRSPVSDDLLALENEVDQQRHAVWREAVTYMLQDARNIEPCAHVLMVARYLERCGDNIVKMAEKIHYAASGERVVLN